MQATNSTETKWRAESLGPRQAKVFNEAAGESVAISSTDGVTISENEEKDGVEIRFSSRPPQAVLDRLKANGWRWSRFSACWYHKRNAEAIAFAAEIAGGSK